MTTTTTKNESDAGTTPAAEPDPRRWIERKRTISNEIHELGLLDQRGRKIGARAVHSEYEVIPFQPSRSGGSQPDSRFEGMELGTRVRFLYVQAARDGKGYGASQDSVYVGRVDDPATEAKANAEVQRRLATMRRRYERRAATRK